MTTTDDFDDFVTKRADPNEEPPHHVFSDIEQWRSECGEQVEWYVAQLPRGWDGKTVRLRNPTSTPMSFTVWIGYPRHVLERRERGMRASIDRRNLRCKVVVPAGATVAVPSLFIRASHSLERQPDGTVMIVAGGAPGLEIVDMKPAPILHPALRPRVDEPVKQTGRKLRS